MVHQPNHGRQHVHLRRHLRLTDRDTFPHIHDSKKIEYRWISRDFFPDNGDQLTQTRCDAVFVEQRVEASGFCRRRGTADTTQPPAAFCTLGTTATATATATTGTGADVIGFADITTTTAAAATPATVAAVAAPAHM